MVEVQRRKFPSKKSFQVGFQGAKKEVSGLKHILAQKATGSLQQTLARTLPWLEVAGLAVSWPTFTCLERINIYVHV